MCLEKNQQAKHRPKATHSDDKINQDPELPEPPQYRKDVHIFQRRPIRLSDAGTVLLRVVVRFFEKEA